MKYLYLLIILIFATTCFSQQVYPPSVGWRLVYDDTLGLGTKTSAYSYNGAGTMGFSDTTNLINIDGSWGASTLALNLDLQNTGKTADSLEIKMAGYNGETLQLQQYYTTTGSILTRIDTLHRTNVADGEYYINLAGKSNGTWWQNLKYIVFYVGGLDTVRVRLYIKNY
jgi:hypothetical protein